MNKISEEDQSHILTTFLNLQTKDEQDLYLQSLIDVEEIKRRRPRKDEPRVNSKAFKYHTLVGSSRVEVCFKAFLSLFSISKKRVERLRALKLSGQTPVDKRGHHVKKAFSEDTKLHIRQHIESFPTKTSHYLGKPVEYLDPSLNKKTMHRLFLSKYPNEKISYEYFSNYFEENYRLPFGRPQIDSCCKCEELELKIKSPHLNEAAKRAAQAELDVHKRKSKKFYNKIKVDADDKNNNHIISLCFDFMQNIQLPKIPVQETFYLRQLSVNIFCIHDIKRNKADMFVYHEGIAHKGPNDVCSFLLSYLQKLKTDSPHYTELHLYSDNCWGQNKNHSLTRLLIALTELNIFENIQQYYPIRGHSFLPCDRDFSIIKRELGRHDRLYTVDQVIDLVLKSSKNEKFKVHKVSTDEIMNFADWWPIYYKKSCISEGTRGNRVPKEQKKYYSISATMHSSFSSEFPGIVVTRPFIDSMMTDVFKFPISGRPNLQLPSQKAYSEGRVPIKKAKLDDIKKLQPYVPAEFEEFFGEIYMWPTIEAEVCEED